MAAGGVRVFAPPQAAPSLRLAAGFTSTRSGPLERGDCRARSRRRRRWSASQPAPPDRVRSRGAAHCADAEHTHAVRAV